MVGSSVMTRRSSSRRITCSSENGGPVRAKVAANRLAISADRPANSAARRRGAPPRSVPARTMPAQAMPIQISLTRVTASMKAWPLGPPVAPSWSLAMIAAVKPASAAA